MGGAGLLVLAILLLGCSSKPKTPPPLSELISGAHGLSGVPKQTALKGTLVLAMESLPTVEAGFTIDLATGHIRLVMSDQSIIIFDGQHAYVWPGSAPYKNTRATCLAYASLVGLPFRLRDSGAHVTDRGVQALGSASYAAADVTFSSGTPGTPDDWYIVFANAKSHRVEAVAFSLALSQSADELRPSSRAVTFYDFQPADNLIVPREWRFWRYHKTEGLYSRPIGSARLRDLSVVNSRPAMFTPPPDSRLDDAP